MRSMLVTFSLSGLSLRLLRSLVARAAPDDPTGAPAGGAGGAGPVGPEPNTVTVGKGRFTGSTLVLTGVTGDTVNLGSNHVQVRDGGRLTLSDLALDDTLPGDSGAWLGDGFALFLRGGSGSACRMVRAN